VEVKDTPALRNASRLTRALLPVPGGHLASNVQSNIERLRHEVVEMCYEL
jgi:hypothetical protein